MRSIAILVIHFVLHKLYLLARFHYGGEYRV